MCLAGRLVRSGCQAGRLLIDFEGFNRFQDIDKNRDFNVKALIKFYRNYYRCLLCYI